MVDEEARADDRAGMDVDVADQPGEERQQPRRIAPLGPPQAMREAIEHDRVHPRIGGEHLEGGARRRIALEHAADIVAPLAEQAHARPPATRMGAPCSPSWR
ncbi:hypothetical protein D3C80_1876770 [compost metagenome]